MNSLYNTLTVLVSVILPETAIITSTTSTTNTITTGSRIITWYPIKKKENIYTHTDICVDVYRKMCAYVGGMDVCVCVCVHAYGYNSYNLLLCW